MKAKFFSVLFVAAALTACLSVSAFAENYNIADGNIVINAKADGKQYVTQSDKSITDQEQTTETVIAGTSTTNTITITAETGQTATVTLSGVDIDVSSASKAALSTSGAGDVVVKLSGCNTLASGFNCAGLQKGNNGTLTISGTNAATDSLTATGGAWAAGIGGGTDSSVSNITIINSTVTAASSGSGAGIGGGYNGNGTDIEIKNSIVTATGGKSAAGIGGGSNGYGSNITITDSTVTAKGGQCGAGIGGGEKGSGRSITISGSSRVRVKGGEGDEDGNEEDVDSRNPHNCSYTIAGSAIGNGSDMNKTLDNSITNSFQVSYEELDASKLTTAGWVKCYAPKQDMDREDPIKTIPGTVPVPEPETKTHSSSGTTNYRLIHTYIEGEGSVDPEGDIMVRDGEDKIITFTPAAGYEIGDIVVNHKSVGAVSEYTVKDISGTVNIEVTFVKSGNAVVGTENAKNPTTGAAI